MNSQNSQYGTGSNDKDTPESLILSAKSAIKPGQAFLDSGAAIITPELADKLLVFNKGNRDLSEAVARRYAALMKNNQWGFSAPLMFNDQHRLIDGQHRLKAVTYAQVDVNFTVMLNVPSESGIFIDRGFRRSATHACQIGGKPWVKNMHTGTARYMTAKLTLSDDGVSQIWTAKYLGVEETITVLEKYEESIRYIVDKLASSEVNLATVLSVITKACHTRPKDRPRIEHFCNCLKTSQAKKDDGDNAACLLTETIRKFKKDKGSKNGVNWSAEQHSNCIGVTQVALELFLKRINTVSYGKNGLIKRLPFKDLFPLPSN